MSDDVDEFEESAREQVRLLEDVGRRERIAVACRGSANPAVLAWLAEALALSGSSVVADLGAGLGGPAAWMVDRYRCRVLALEPAGAAARGMGPLFGLSPVRAGAAGVPLRDGCADAALLLGVVSVVPEPAAALREARRVAAGLGLLDYCSTTGGAVTAGGSTFPTPDRLDALLAATGWSVEEAADVDLPSPPSWSRAVERLSPEHTPDDEAEVAAAVADGRIRPRLLVAT